MTVTDAAGLLVLAFLAIVGFVWIWLLDGPRMAVGIIGGIVALVMVLVVLLWGAVVLLESTEWFA